MYPKDSQGLVGMRGLTEGSIVEYRWDDQKSVFHTAVVKHPCFRDARHRYHAAESSIEPAKPTSVNKDDCLVVFHFNNSRFNR